MSDMRYLFNSLNLRDFDYVCIYINERKYIYIYTHTQTHTHIYIYIYIYEHEKYII